MRLDIFERFPWVQSLLNRLLLYSRVGQTDKITDDVAVAGVVRDIAKMYSLLPHFVARYNDSDGSVLRTERVALQMVLQKLISNSVKHHYKPQGRINISTRLADGLTEFRVSDDGPGIPKPFQERMFKIFQTLKRHDDPDSSGIGLALVKRKVESHGGRISVESAPPARGTTFTFTWKETVNA